MVVSIVESDNWIGRSLVSGGIGWSGSEVLGSMALGWMFEVIGSGMGKEIANSLRKSGS